MNIHELDQLHVINVNMVIILQLIKLNYKIQQLQY